MNRCKKLCTAIALTGTLAGCSTTNLGLNPTVPEEAGGSISKAAGKLACEKRPEAARASCKGGKGETYGLEEVKEAFDNLYNETRTASNKKNKQEWAYGEIASTGGFGAVVGQLASQAALLNSGIALATVGLSMDSFYKPGTTKLLHLRAEVMFQCLQRELSHVSEGDRASGELAAFDTEDEKIAQQRAASAVRDAVEQIDAAITLYRHSVLTQAVAFPQNSDFSRFAKAYANETKVGEEASAKSNAFAEPAVKKERAAASELEAAGKRLVAAKSNKSELEKKTTSKDVKALSDADVQALNRQIKSATDEVTQAEEAKKNAEDAAKAATADAKSAKAKVAAAKFVAFRINLEKCVRLPGS